MNTGINNVNITVYTKWIYSGQLRVMSKRSSLGCSEKILLSVLNNVIVRNLNITLKSFLQTLSTVFLKQRTQWMCSSLAKRRKGN